MAVVGIDFGTLHSKVRLKSVPHLQIAHRVARRSLDRSRETSRHRYYHQ